MGAKQVKQPIESSTNILNENNSGNNTLLRVKRQRKSTSNNQLNRQSSSPQSFQSKWRMSSFFNDLTNSKSSNGNEFEENSANGNGNGSGRGSGAISKAESSIHLTASSSKSSMSVSTQPSPPNKIVELNKQMKDNQQKLTNIIKQADSNQPSYHMNSKLYRPNSFLMANSNPVQLTSNRPKNTKQQRTITSPAAATTTITATHEKTNTLPRTHVQINATNNNNKSLLPQSNDDSNSNSNSNNNSNSNPIKIPVTSKIAKKLGLSPRFKRKIVETIANKVSSTNQTSASNSNLNHKSTNSIFSQSRLIQALQSQWNLFSSIRLSRNHLNESGDNEYDNNCDNTSGNPNHNRRNRTETTATFLSTSLERNSFRYASRRKYKTQSLANPFRHADTNYPVYIHEALFMPEFSVKGQVTEADFEILDVISRGAFGHVIKVKKKDLAEDQSATIYAMKIMWKSQVIRDRALQQVKDEVTIAMNCVDNPLIVKTWHYWQSKRFLYIITDFVENGELLSLWLKVHHFPERLAILYAVEMSLVLDYLHKHGIIYRDIKMENILLDQRGHIQLIDFGLSKWLRLGERTGTICGTIQYMAPEILSVEPYDHAVDWWSLGILIYALLSGEYPLNAAKDHIQMNEKVSKHVFELDRSRGNYTDEACDLIRKLLRKNAQRRLKSLNEIKKEPFFLKEVDLFVNKTLDAEYKSSKRGSAAGPTGANSTITAKSDQMSDADKRLVISDNFWNPYVIMENYSPLQMLFDEIYALKQKQQQMRLTNKINKVKHSVLSPPPPPPPPPKTAPSSVPASQTLQSIHSAHIQQNQDQSSSSSTDTMSTNKSASALNDEVEYVDVDVDENDNDDDSVNDDDEDDEINHNPDIVNEYDGDSDQESETNSFTKF